MKNPREGNAEAIRAGADVYRARCATCHPAKQDLTRTQITNFTDSAFLPALGRGILYT